MWYFEGLIPSKIMWHIFFVLLLSPSQAVLNIFHFFQFSKKYLYGHIPLTFLKDHLENKKILSGLIRKLSCYFPDALLKISKGNVLQIFFINVQNNWKWREAYPITKTVSRVTPLKKILLDKSVDDWSINITIIKIVFSQCKSTSFEKLKLKILERTNMKKKVNY